MVEVFKTNIEDKLVADSLVQELGTLFPGSSVNFDLDDCDRILRIAGPGVIPAHITALLLRRGHLCEILE